MNLYKVYYSLTSHPEGLRHSPEYFEYVIAKTYAQAEEKFLDYKILCSQVDRVAFQLNLDKYIK